MRPGATGRVIGRWSCLVSRPIPTTFARILETLAGGIIRAGHVVNGLGSKLEVNASVIVPHCPLQERRHRCAQRFGHKSLPYCPVGLSAALGSGNNLVKYVKFKEVCSAGDRSQPTCLFSIGYWMISSGGKSDSASLSHSWTQISSQVTL